MALLAIESVPLESTLEMTLPARPNVLAGLRRTLDRWLQAAGDHEDELFDITLSTSEAAANAIEHAYGAYEATFTVRCEQEDRQVTVTVSDAGRWRTARSMSPLGIEKVDAVPIAHVDEDIDAANVTAIQQQLANALGPDALSLVIDLSDTRYLDSAGIDMLLRLSDRLNLRRAKLIVVIPDASQLRRLATIVGLPEAIAVHSSRGDALQEAAEMQARAVSHSDLPS